MRRITTTVLLAAAVLASLAACGSTSDDKTPAKPKASPSVSKEGKFLDAVHLASWRSWAERQPSDGDLIDFPQEWCDGLGAGHSVKWMFDEGGLYPYGQDWGTQKQEANELLLMGVKAYCPELREQVVSELRDSGAY
ncbi:hypothetical protein [Streptomyces sp900116325]|uniref:hypothetical protein n=1 Tax=Streptomyces sp. 900116325 TaxID=3154295 RepID=UPI0033B12067